ncbi:MAG: DUF5996 family protein, partial [Candidatus Baltobacteraceae bacterium]
MDEWPSLPLDEWRKTCDTLHMYSQIAGKIRLALAPMEPQWANVPLYVTARGLTTSAIPCGNRNFSIEFDFVAHNVDIVVSDGKSRAIALADGKSVADFYAEMMDAMLAYD